MNFTENKIEKENIFIDNNYSKVGNNEFRIHSPLKSVNNDDENVIIHETPCKNNSDINLSLNISDTTTDKHEFSILRQVLKYLNQSDTSTEVDDETSTMNWSNLNVNDSTLKTPDVSTNYYCTDDGLSPEMFSDDDKIIENETSTSLNVSSLESCYKLDRKVLNRLKESFVGIIPPPSITNCSLSAKEMLNLYHTNINIASNTGEKLSLICNCNETDVINATWPNVLQLRYHGLHYNRSKICEETEQLFQKYVERFIGDETSTLYSNKTNNLNAAQKRQQLLRKQQLCKSPGRRLSHLAKRRITFSKDNLNTSTRHSVLPSLSISNRQILIDVKKNDVLLRKRISPRKQQSANKQRRSPRKLLFSPRKRTPRKTPTNKRTSPYKKLKKTPTTNSAVKRNNNYRKTPTRSENTSMLLSSKRALFQSPETKQPAVAETTSSSSTTIQIQKSKRALFPSNDIMQVNDDVSRKRKRTDNDNDEFTPQRDKFPRSLSSSDATQNCGSGITLIRHYSEMNNSKNLNDFSDHHRKKMLWAISTALRSQQIGMNHPNFKTYASTLSQVCKRLLSDLLPGGVRQPGSVSERMSKIAHQHVYAVVKGGKTVDEICDAVKAKSIVTKPKGYIAPDANQTSSLNTTLVNSQLLDRSRIRRQITFDKIT